MSMSLDLDEIRDTWLNLCGPHDAGVNVGCACADGDYRPVMLRLVEEVERLRASREDPTNDIEATGECCCNGCIGVGPCDLGEPCSHGCGAMTLTGGPCASCERELIGEDIGLCGCDEDCTCVGEYPTQEAT